MLATAKKGMAIRVNTKIRYARSMAVEGGPQGELSRLISDGDTCSLFVLTKGDTSMYTACDMLWCKYCERMLILKTFYTSPNPL